VADTKKSVKHNVDGIYYVDTTCINCGVSRHYAPAHFGDDGLHAYVKRQPVNKEEQRQVQLALLACPTGSIGMRLKQDLSAAREAFPLPLADHVYINGFNHRNSYGAHSYFIHSDDGNWLVDSPRFTSHLVNKFEAMGGLDYIFLSHRDDVCDAHRYAKHFGAKRIIHALDADAQPEAEIILEGEAVCSIDDAQIHFTPGHTRGHMVLLWDTRYLFSGDHFAWLADEQRFGSFRNACWYSWEKQIDSVQLMRDFTQVEWVFPGHGKWGQIEPGRFPHIIDECVAEMRNAR
jgi:glyoxylase-like metal-dependent hydrolase (beta-lactamase superfamily II)/ferredoxin